MNLLAAADEGVELALLLSFLIDAQIENGVPEAGDVLEGDASAKRKVADLQRSCLREVRALARVARCVHVCNIVGGGLDRPLLGEHRLRGNVQTGV